IQLRVLMNTLRLRLRLTLIAVALLTSFALSACGEKKEAVAPASGTTQSLTMMLDWFPNADHVGIYQALAGGDFSSARLDVHVLESSVKESNVGSNLVPAMLAGRVDATLGAYWNYEAIQLQQLGKRPNVIRMDRVGVPTYDELVVVARSSELTKHIDVIRRFV